MVFRVLCIFLLGNVLFSFDLTVNKKIPKIFRAYEYSNIALEIELKENITIAGVLPPESEKIIIKPSSNSIISIEDKNKIAKFDFTVLPKEKGKFNLKPFKILYFEGEPKDEEPKTFEYNLGELIVKGRYFYKNLYFWYFAGILFLIFVIIFIIFIRRSYGKRNSTSEG